ncbi:MAG: hypothetical protein COA78_17680 [Blastopirellula sp.]|nr:MAG: hypothetical protein COA78_17680 [Blastopirellula sp.]
MDKFYNDEELLSKSHSTKIKFMQGDRKKDVSLFNDLVRVCFQRFQSSLSRRISLDDIKISNGSMSDSFIENKADLTSLYLSNYYEIPNILELNPSNREEEYDRYEDPKSVLDTFRKALYNRKGLAVLIGDVGEGKSTFLSKLSLELRSESCSNEGFSFVPVIIDVQKFMSNAGELDVLDESKIIQKFWEEVREKIEGHLSNRIEIVVYSALRSVQKYIEKKLSFRAALKFDEVEAEVEIGKPVTTDNEEGVIKLVKNFDYIRRYSKKMEKEDCRLVLIFDNLDTFYYDHERFIFTPDGHERMRSKVRIIRRIFEDAVSQFYGENDSFLSSIFTARPYVYEQVFLNSQTADTRMPLPRLFSLVPVEPQVVVHTRLLMLEHLIKYINKSDVKGGKKDALNLHYGDFMDFVSAMENQVGNHGNALYVKLHAIANQGFRSVIDFYDEYFFYSGNRNFESFFSHNVLYMYLLDMMQAYSQVSPEFCEHNKKAHFPNMFLVRGDAHCNGEYKDYCHDQTKPLYFLKYLILLIVASGEHRVREIFNILSDYEESILQIALGGLSTINDSNCIQLRFTPDEQRGHQSLIDTTLAKLTNRGSFLIENDYCFSFECLQFYWEDYLLMRPKMEFLNIPDSEFGRYLDPTDATMTYDYFLHSDEGYYQSSREMMIRGKAKKSIVLVELLRGAVLWESGLHSASWARIKLLNGSTKSFFEDGFFDNVSEKVIADSKHLVSHGGEFATELREIRQSIRSNSIYTSFFEELLAERSEKA